MIYLKQFSCGPLETNAYLIGQEGLENTVLIDAPPDSWEIIHKTLVKDGRELSALLITHPHFDHIIDAHKFASTGIPVFALEGAEHGIAHPVILGSVFPPMEELKGTAVTRSLSAGESLHFDGLDFLVFSVPGHCGSSAAFYEKNLSLCFVGDLIFKGSVGRTDIPDADFNILVGSIQKNIYTLPEEVILLPGHGPSTTVGDEKHSNPFVRETG